MQKSVPDMCLILCGENTKYKHPAVRLSWSYRRVAVYGSSIYFFAGCLLIFSTPFSYWKV